MWITCSPQHSTSTSSGQERFWTNTCATALSRPGISFFRPAFVAIEATLADGEGRIDVEPARSWAVVRSLQRLPVASLDEPAPAVLACCEGETHTLALEALRGAE
jgi:hypothetical protein